MKFDISKNSIAIISFTISALGILIVNTYLNSQYFFANYSILSIRAMHTGIMFLLISSLSVAFIFAFIETYEWLPEQSLCNIINFITKPIHLTNIFIMIFLFTANSPDKSFDYSFFNFFSFKSYWLYPILMSSVFGYLEKLLVFPFYEQAENNKLENEPSITLKPLMFGHKFFNSLIYVGLFSLPIMLYNSTEYKNALYFFGNISFLCFITYSICMIENNRIKQNRPEVNYSLYTKHLNSHGLNFLDVIYGVSWTLLLLITFAINYSKNIYPLIDFQYGGGKPICVSIQLQNGETLQGNIINFDDNRYYMELPDEEKTEFVNYTEIKTVQKIQ